MTEIKNKTAYFIGKFYQRLNFLEGENLIKKVIKLDKIKKIIGILKMLEHYSLRF